MDWNNGILYNVHQGYRTIKLSCANKQSGKQKWAASRQQQLPFSHRN